MRFLVFCFALFFSLKCIAQFENLPVQSNGRVKPFQTFARENILFLTGKYKFNNLNAESFYLSLVNNNSVDQLEFINIRSVSAKKKLGLPVKQLRYSIKELGLIPFDAIVQPLFAKSKMDTNNLTPDEKSIVEAYHQYKLALSVKAGEHFLQAVDFSFGELPNDSLFRAASLFLAQNSTENFMQLKQEVLKQNMPEELSKQVKNIDLEVTYNNWRLFLVSALGLLALGIYCLTKFKKNKKIISLIFLIPILSLVVGFCIRIVITGFAPVTNMYGTMLWVAFGIALFSYLLLMLYSHYILVGVLWIGAGFMLLLTESIPLILSPDLDPIVAVLRSNLWLSIHVLTITISYAAFTICMLLSNYILITSLFKKVNKEHLKSIAHSIYRMTQLGVFLLSVGIILGGVWADYSWGRFWGWDPKETWALIADIGFLAILHARFVGWLGEWELIVTAPIAYLLVIMAWYGVNFILATGLHSYGFSSGGAQIVFGFVLFQILLISASLAKKQLKG